MRLSLILFFAMSAIAIFTKYNEHVIHRFGASVFAPLLLLLVSVTAAQEVSIASARIPLCKGPPRVTNGLARESTAYSLVFHSTGLKFERYGCGLRKICYQAE